MGGQIPWRHGPFPVGSLPGLVALYDIRPGNGAGPFLQPRSPHGAIEVRSISRRAGDNTKISCNQTKKEYDKPRQSNTLLPGLYGDDPLATVRLSQRSLSRQSLGK